MPFAFDNTYARLPDRFFARIAPTPVRAARVVARNAPLAALLGLAPEELAGDGAQVFAGNTVPAGADPIALAYAGHQFGTFVPQLGDGRAILLGEVVGADGVRRDVQLKGAGRTPFSRGGDGRAALGPVLREYVVSEAMAALGVPTTRALAATVTGETVAREEPLPGAILTRVARSHLRVGTFEYFAARDDREALALLARYALDRHYGGASDDGEPLGAALLDKVLSAQAALVAQWIGLGFVHGVMNTDNTSIAGETIDYGPCAFLDAYDPRKRFSAIDHGGRYAFANQPRIALWNLARLGEALLPTMADDEDEAARLATRILERFPARFEEHRARVYRAKLGLAREEPDDVKLADDVLERLAASEVDHTLFFRRLCDAGSSEGDAAVSALFGADPGPYHAWATAWRARLAREEAPPAARAAAMRRANPARIPRNHRVEEALRAATVEGDFTPFEALCASLERPFDDDPRFARYEEAPSPAERVARTFCGT